MVLIEEIYDGPEEASVPVREDDQDVDLLTEDATNDEAGPSGAHKNDDEWVHVDTADVSGSSAPTDSNLEAEIKPEASQEQQQDDPEVSKEKLKKAEELKQEGNTLFAAENFEEAIEKYSLALEEAPETALERSVYFGNRAACFMRLEHYEEAAHDCSAALEIDPKYIKVLIRRSTAYEAVDDLERAFADVQKALELDPSNSVAKATVVRLEPIVNERREKLKEEMLSKLKDLGNTILGKFGMSLDNFKAEQDPSTGGYSIKFQQ